MARSRRTMIRAALTLTVILSGAKAFAYDSAPQIRAEPSVDRLSIRIDDRPFATYVFADAQTPRPYFCNVHAPSGVLVTRPRPLGPDDFEDHAQMHPGIWLAFGDVNGHDCWRLKAPVKHVEFVEAPTSAGNRLMFVVRNRYSGNGGAPVLCEEVCRYTITAQANQTVISWDSRFEPGEKPLVFGDQEEMGLGVRLASVIAEKSDLGGRLTDSEGRTTAKQVWGQAASWCDYSGLVDGKLAGITVAGHPDNIRPCWWHARDYGFMAANLFSRHAMKQGEASRVTIQPGETFRLRFTVIVHDGRPADGYDPTASLTRGADN